MLQPSSVREGFLLLNFQEYAIFKTKMPSIKTTTPILGGSYYHLFNRGVNKQKIFYNNENYEYFLRLLNKFLYDYVHFLAYSLLSNHFHLILKIKEEVDLNNIDLKGNHSFNKENSSLNQIINNENEIGKLVVRQLKRLFITYSMAINNQEKRTGNLFDPKFKRLEITNQDYLEYAIFYTHYNPEKHGITNDFKDYRYSSYKAILSSSETKIDRKLVFELYGGKREFIYYHQIVHDERESIILE